MFLLFQIKCKCRFQPPKKLLLLMLENIKMFGTNQKHMMLTYYKVNALFYKIMVNVVPLPGSLFTEMVPPCFSTILLT